jgi:hypothetical protein
MRLGKRLREFDAAGVRSEVPGKAKSEESQAIGGDVLQLTPRELFNDAVVEGTGFLELGAPGAIEGFGKEFVFDGSFIGNALGVGAAPANESGPADAEFGSDGGVRNAPGAECDETFDEFGIFLVHDA